MKRYKEVQKITKEFVIDKLKAGAVLYLNKRQTSSGNSVGSVALLDDGEDTFTVSPQLFKTLFRQEIIEFYKSKEEYMGRVSTGRKIIKIKDYYKLK
jgi:hypothetical protein